MTEMPTMAPRRREEEQAEADPAPRQLSPLSALVILILLVPLLGCYIGLTLLFKNQAVWAGYLFLFYWGGVRHMAQAAFAPALVGSLGGTVLAWALHAGPLYAQAAGAAALIGLALAIYCQMCGWLPLLLNVAFMMMLTVGTIPAVAALDLFPHMLGAILIAASYFGALMLALNWVQRTRANKAVPA